MTPDQIARLRELRKKAGAKGSTWSEVAEWMAAISNAAPDLLDAAERENQKHEGWTRCETHHSWMLLPDAECPSCKIAALESALAKAEHWLGIERDVSDRLKMALRMPGTGNYVEWAKECRNAVDALARVRERAARWEAVAIKLCSCLPSSSNDHEHFDPMPGQECHGCSAYELSESAYREFTRLRAIYPPSSALAADAEKEEDK